MYTSRVSGYWNRWFFCPQSTARAQWSNASLCNAFWPPTTAQRSLKYGGALETHGEGDMGFLNNTE